MLRLQVYIKELYLIGTYVNGNMLNYGLIFRGGEISEYLKDYAPLRYHLNPNSQMKDLRKYAMEHRENGEAEHLIKTITSDELYPWPKGTDF